MQSAVPLSLFLISSGTFCNNFDFIDVETKISEFDTLRYKCVQNGAEETTFNSLLHQPILINSCLQQYLNYSSIVEEIEAAKNTSTVDEVAWKYCLKYPEISECLKVASDQLRPCLDATENQFLTRSFDFFQQLKEHVCLGQGDRIAMFISARGLECLQIKEKQLQDCINGTIGEKILQDGIGSLLGLFSATNDTCRDLMDIRYCFYSELLDCHPSVTANIMDSFFRFVKKEFRCNTTYEFVYAAKKDYTWVRIIVITLYFFVVAPMVYKLAKQ